MSRMTNETSVSVSYAKVSKWSMVTKANGTYTLIGSPTNEKTIDFCRRSVLGWNGKKQTHKQNGCGLLGVYIFIPISWCSSHSLYFVLIRPHITKSLAGKNVSIIWFSHLFRCQIHMFNNDSMYTFSQYEMHAQTLTFSDFVE